MRVQKWLVRSLVFSLLLGLGGVGYLCYWWTDPALVREQVLLQTGAMFPGADVTLEAARLRLLGDILLTDLRLIRRDDPARTDVVYIPSAVVHHDKEQLLDGKLVIRKIELLRPRLRLIRAADGKWNVEGLAAPGDPAEPLPLVVVTDGTLLFEDRHAAPEFPPLEISDVNLTLVNDPTPVVTFQGSGRCAFLGKIELQGEWNREFGRLSLTADTSDGELTTAFIRRLAGRLAAEELAGLEIKGAFASRLELCIDSSGPTPLDYDLSCRLRRGECSHPKVPLLLQHLDIEARCVNGELTVTSLRATSGPTKIAAKGSGRLHDLANNFRGWLRLEHLPVCDELCLKLPAEVQKIHELYKPCGPLSLEFDLACAGGEWQRKHLVLRPENIQLCFRDFPYPVRQLSGTLDMDLLTNRIHVDVRSQEGSKDIRLAGTWKGTGSAAEATLKLHATGVPLDDILINALPPDYRELARSFHAQGRADIYADMRRQPGDETFRSFYRAQFYQARVRWDQFPYPLEDVSGVLDIYPDHFEFHRFQGRHKSGQVYVWGQTFPVDPRDRDKPPRLVINLAGRDVGIDAGLRSALRTMPNLAAAWDTFSPAGKLNFQCCIDQPPRGPQDLNINLEVKGCSIEPRFYPYPLHDLSGKFHFTKNRLMLRDVQARHNATQVSIAHGLVDISPGGGFYADLQDVVGNPVFPDDGCIDALPRKVREAVSFLDRSRPIALRARLVIARDEDPAALPDVYWRGSVWVRDATLRFGVNVERASGQLFCVGRYDGDQLQGVRGRLALERASIFGQPLRDAHADFHIRKEAPETLVIGLHAPLFGGDLSGQARVDLYSTIGYEINLTATQIDLQEFGKHNIGTQSKLRGKASARLHLTGKGNDPDALAGNGTIDVPQGKLYNLPFLLDLLKFLGLRWPDHTAFEEAHADFSIHGRRVSINRMDLWGNAISMTCQGEVNLDGTDVKLDVYPSWARLEQVLPPAMRDLSPALSKNLLKIEATGTLMPKTDLKFHFRPVPGLVDPLLQLRGRVAGLEAPGPFAVKLHEGAGR